ncbi:MULTISPECIES: holo-ACP synthase [Ruminococcus]|uniref:Holo-[acyl-carrier-protein] synthase n=1 Tax=Ruminococcus albus 8 TaxID=246199 RepID=E9SAU8_RUMAL|nr:MULTISPECIES: holo-ACP synthase [Ruminococcus]EGC03544.1 holo-[acyl-carrier-protein] synthase [Ruminococcus albus 8]MBR0528424.1 holo-ACP synthase [Ruminococcus sp.]MCC3349916.1 holo-ACP synthase [Ruminococcus albus 8]
MAAISVGTDIVEVGRIRKSCQRDSFVRRVYAAEELEYFSAMRDPAESMAGSWAAKEAFSKSLGTGVRGFELTEVAVVRDKLGCPHLKLRGKAKAIAEERRLDFSLSISHTKEYATATVIAFAK